jgi:hypothetical protein
MRFSIRKFHALSTGFAVSTIFISTTMLFLMQLDSLNGLDIFPQSWEPVVRMMSWGFGVIALGSSGMSIVLSLFRSAEK